MWRTITQRLSVQNCSKHKASPDSCQSYVSSVGFALPSVANVFILKILCAFCIIFMEKWHRQGVMKTTCLSRVSVLLGKLPLVQRKLFSRGCTFKKWMFAANSQSGQTSWVLCRLLLSRQWTGKLWRTWQNNVLCAQPLSATCSSYFGVSSFGTGVVHRERDRQREKEREKRTICAQIFKT